MLRSLCNLLYVIAIVVPGLAVAQPVANFSANVLSGCSPIVVQFSDQSTGNPSGWSWNLGNGSNSTLQNPSTTYITPGTYTVTLTVANTGGSNTKTVTNYITVFPSPIVSFMADSIPSCSPKSVQFTNLTVPGSVGTTGYTWDLGNGQTSTLSNPIHTYSTVGNYTITLLATNSNGCSNSLTKTNYIQLTAKPQAAFTASSTNGCIAPFTANFNNASTGATSYHWDFGDGQTSTAANPGHTYATTGSFTVRLIATNAAGCKDTVLKTAYVFVGAPDASFSVTDSTLCVGQTVTFTSSLIPSSAAVTWLFGDGNSTSAAVPTHSYAAAGSYTAKIIVSQGACSDTAQKTIIVGAKPASQFTVSGTQSCMVPFSTQFTNTSSGATAYLWIFGDGTTSTLQNPSKTYNTAGQFTVRLVAYNAAGCTDTFAVNSLIKIQTMTSSLFSDVLLNPIPDCAPATTTLSGGQSAALLFNISSYAWNFGNGNTATTTGPSVSQTYNSAGTYSVSLTYNTIPGCSFTKQRTLSIGAKPVASFSPGPDTVCPNTAISFANNTTGAASYKWYFGDGDSSTAANPNYTYRLAGDFAVTLIATNGTCGDTAVIPERVHVQLPTAWFIPSFSCTNRLLFTFTDGSSGANIYSWNFGDGQTSTQSGTVTHQFPSYGTYHVLLTVTNTATGCSDFYGMNVFSYPLSVQFSASDTTVCTNQTTVFSATPIPHAANYAWHPGDGGFTSSGFHVGSYTYLTSGIYNVKLVVTDSNGCKDSLVRPNHMHVGGTTLNFTASQVSGCAPLNVTLTDQSTSVVGAITNRVWQFGDYSSQSTTSTTVSHIYPDGTYFVKLKVTDILGCQDSLTKTNYIVASTAVASFTSTDTNVCPGQQVSFANSSNSATVMWYFGDGQTSTAYSTSHIYSTPGNYTVKLVVMDQNGCKDSMIRTAYIKVQPLDLNFATSDSFANCPPLTVNFTAGGGVTSYNWTFGNNSQSVLANPSTIYTYPGVYTVKLKAQNSVGCADSATKTVTVLGPTGTLSYNPVSGCKPLTVAFTSTNINTQSLVWDMSNGVTQTTSASSGYTYTYTQAGKFVPKLILSDGASCLVPITGADTIRVDSLGADFSFTPASLCQSGTIQFTDMVNYSLSAVNTRSWTFGDGGSSTVHNPAHTYAAPGTYQVTLVVDNISGCNDTVTKTITIYAQPSVSAGNNVAICEGQATPVQLLATGATSYVWSPATGLSCNTCSNPTVTSSATTTFTVVGTDNNGCKDTNTVTVTVNPLPSVTAGNSQAICLDDSTQLQATGAATYSWSPATGLSCTTCSNPKASPAVTTSYVVTGASSNGCIDTGIVTITVNPLPNVSAGANKVICLGDSAQLEATGANTYVWSPTTGLSCTTCANLKAGPTITTTYIVTGTNAHGCVDTGTVAVTVNPLPNVTAGNNQSICISGSAQLQASGATVYSWSPSTGLSCTNCANPVASPVTTTTYTVTGASADGCSNTATVTVTVNAIPVVTASAANSTICEGANTTLHAAGAGSYIWTPAGGLSCANCLNPVASPATTTTYIVKGSVNGCEDTAHVTVTVLPKPNVSAGNNAGVCFGNAVTLHASGAQSYVWSPAMSLSCTTCTDPVAAPAATTAYTVTGTGANGCTGDASVTVTIHPVPNIDAGEDRTLCSGSSIKLTATGGVNYVWSPALNLNCTNCSSPAVNPLVNTTYKVVGTDAFGCSDSDAVNIVVIDKQPVSISPDADICEGGSIQLLAKGGTSYSWFPAYGLSSTENANTVATPASTTRYNVVIKQGECFIDTVSVKVEVHRLPTVDAGPDQNAVAGNTVQLKALGTEIASYLWSPSDKLSCADCQTPVADMSRTTIYTVEVKSKWGCVAKDDITVYVNCDANQLFVANTFTPNGDGINDEFYPQGKGITSIQRFRVFNRWGELVYEANNIPLNDARYGWDGTHRMEPLKPDVFVYVINASCESGEPIEIKGDVTLVR